MEKMAGILKGLSQKDFRGHLKGCKACTERCVAYSGNYFEKNCMSVQ